MFSIRNVKLLALAVLCALPATGLAYHIDSHYYLRFGLSLSTCFNWDEAHLIASGDWGMDENTSTHAEMNPLQTRNKIGWHAFGHSDKRFRELWLRSVSEPDLELRMIKLGQFMHFLEDWEAHAGYGIRMGHARDTFRGRDPDSLGNSLPKNHRMIQSALDHLLATCEDLGRLDGDRDEELVRIMKAFISRGLLDDIFDASDPGWKRGTLGGLRPEGLTITTANKTRIEELVEADYKPLPEKGVPQDFEPATNRGISPSLRIPFDQNGNIKTTRSVRGAVREWAAASKPAADVTLSLQSARIYYRSSRQYGPGGWQVLLYAANQGQLVSQQGQIELLVIDSDDETVLAKLSEPLPVMQPGESREFRIRIPAKGRPEPDAIISSFARVDDLSAMNDEDWLMLGDADEEQPDVPIITDVDPPASGPETVRFLQSPKTFIVDNAVCLLVTALVSGGDSPAKLDEVVFEVLGGTLGSYALQQVVVGRWSAMSTENGLVGGKTFECFRPDAETYELLGSQDPQALKLAVTLQAEGTDFYTKVFPIDPQFVEDVLKIPRLVE